MIQLAPFGVTNPPPVPSLVGGFYNIDSSRDCSADPVCTVTFGHAGGEEGERKGGWVGKGGQEEGRRAWVRGRG